LIGLKKRKGGSECDDTSKYKETGPTTKHPRHDTSHVGLDKGEFISYLYLDMNFGPYWLILALTGSFIFGHSDSASGGVPSTNAGANAHSHTIIDQRVMAMAYITRSLLRIRQVRQKVTSQSYGTSQPSYLEQRVE